MPPDHVSLVLDRVADAYSRCSSYCDTGEFRTGKTSMFDDSSLRDGFYFSTIFARPRQFRFEFDYEAPGQKRIRGYNVLLQSGGSVRFYSKGSNAVAAFPNRRKALQRSVSNAAFKEHIVSQLLSVKDSRKVLEQHYGSTSYQGDQDQLGSTCHVLGHSGPLTTWFGTINECVYIEADTYLIRKTVQQRVGDNAAMIDYFKDRIWKLKNAGIHESEKVSLYKRTVANLNRAPTLKATSESTTVYQSSFDTEIPTGSFEYEPTNS